MTTSTFSHIETMSDSFTTFFWVEKSLLFVDLFGPLWSNSCVYIPGEVYIKRIPPDRAICIMPSNPDSRFAERIFEGLIGTRFPNALG